MTARSDSRRGTRGLIALGIVAAGCSFNDPTLRLPADLPPMEMRATSAHPIFVVSPFEDQRVDVSRCGTKKYGMFNITTDTLRCSEPPETWIAQLLAHQLERAGFAVRTAADDGQSNGLQIRGTLVRLFQEPVMTLTTGRVSFETDLQVVLTVTSADGLVATRSFFAKGRTSGLGLPSEVQQSVEVAAEQLLREMVSAIVSLRNRYPGSAATEPVPSASGLLGWEVRP